MARTLATIIREMRLIETSTMKDAIKKTALAKLEREAEQLSANGEIKEPAKDPRQADIEDPQPTRPAAPKGGKATP